MIIHPEYYLRAMEKANLAADEVCRQWNLLEAMPNLTDDDLGPWLAATEALRTADDEFTEIRWQIYG